MRTEEEAHEDRFVVMLGGMHIEMTEFKVLENWLEKSGWKNTFFITEIVSSGTGIADSYKLCI